MNSLCQLASVWNGRDPTAAALCEIKIDGWRALHLPCRDKRTHLVSRGGIPIEGTAHIRHVLDIMQTLAGEPMVFDGEFQVDGTLAATKAWCQSGWKLGTEAGRFHAFDCLTHAEWSAGGSDVPLVDRKARLSRLLSAAKAEIAGNWSWRAGSLGRDENKPCPVEIIPHFDVYTRSEVADKAMDVWLAGGEGLMIKRRWSPYQRNRTKDWLKVKRNGAWARHTRIDKQLLRIAA